jgi:UDP-2,3-diacylglucosamine hydrolase
MSDTPLGLIAGNGRFPFLVLDAARARGERVIVAAIKEETEPGMTERATRDPGVRVHWLSLGELSKLIETFQREGVNRAIMAGQVKHKQIFSSIRPDWRLAKLLLSIRTRNTDALLGAVGKVLADEGITLLSSTSYLEPLLARAGVLTKRPPSEEERKNILYGREVALHLAQYDIGQTVVLAESACVAVEAMEGTDATILRAGEIMRTLHHEDIPESFLSRALTVVKVAKPQQDLRFDVPVIGLATIETMRRAGAACLAVDAQRCLLLDGDRIIEAADIAGISIESSEG